MVLATRLVACLPYLTAAVFLAALTWRLRRWNRTRAAPSPLFPLSPGLSAPTASGAAWPRIAAEVCLLRGRRADGPGNVAACCFHFSLALILLGHIRAFTDFPRLWSVLSLSPSTVEGLAALAGGAAGLTALGAACVLAGRRLLSPRLRAITRLEDVFALALLLAVIGSGLALRLGPTVDLGPIRAYFAALAAFSPRPMPEIPGFALHFLLAQALFVCLPFGKLSHFVGVFAAKAGLYGKDPFPAPPPA